LASTYKALGVQQKWDKVTIFTPMLNIKLQASEKMKTKIDEDEQHKI